MSDKSDPIKGASALPYPLPSVDGWTGVDADTVRILLRRHSLSAGDVARLLAMRDSAKVRQWIGGTLNVPYPHWYCLLDKINRGITTTTTGSHP